MRNVSCQVHDQHTITPRLFVNNRRDIHPQPATRSRLHFEVEIRNITVLGRAEMNAAATRADLLSQRAAAVQDVMAGPGPRFPCRAPEEAFGWFFPATNLAL